MRLQTAVVLLGGGLALAGCGQSPTTTTPPSYNDSAQTTQLNTDSQPNGSRPSGSQPSGSQPNKAAVEPAAAGSAPVQSSKAQPRTVLDYYNLLPASYFDQGRRPALQANSSEVDIKNDYLQVGWDSGGLVVAVFRHSGQALVAVNSMSMSEGGAIELLRYEQGRWSNVTTQLLPLPRNPNHVYVLPRHGTTITVHQNDEGLPGRQLYQLLWRNGTFHLSGQQNPGRPAGPENVAASQSPATPGSTRYYYPPSDGSESTDDMLARHRREREQEERDKRSAPPSTRYAPPSSNPGSMTSPNYRPPSSPGRMTDPNYNNPYRH